MWTKNEVIIVQNEKRVKLIEFFLLRLLREFKSEYKKNFQPFNKYDFDEQKGVFERRPTVNAFNSTTESDLPSSSWYKEVVLLRQKANQYRVCTNKRFFTKKKFVFLISGNFV